jgi:hypothetical protein
MALRENLGREAYRFYLEGETEVEFSSNAETNVALVQFGSYIL